MSHLRAIALLLIAVVWTAPALSQGTLPRAELERQIEEIMAWWPGSYDNDEQTILEGRQVVQRFHSEVVRVDLPKYGENVLYVEEWKDDNPTNIFRQRLYSLTPDVDAQAVRFTVYYIADGEAVREAYKDEAKRSALATTQAFAIDGCHFLAKRVGNSYFGGLEAKACVYELDGVKQYSDYQFELGADYAWFRERAWNHADDTVYSEVNGYDWIKMKQARQFACMVDWPNPGGNPTLHFITLHDQGGSFTFEAPDGRTLAVGLRNTYGYGMKRATFWVSIWEGAVDEKLLVYGWSEPGADRIGVNPGWIRIQCDLDTTDMRELQHTLYD